MSLQELWEQYRGFAIWLGGIIVVLGAFLSFVGAGWPGGINNCIWGDGTRQTLTPPPANASAKIKNAYNKQIKDLQKQVDDGTINSCYCESFSVSDAAGTTGGVRQKTNTWFNLYSIGTSFFVALWVYFDRRDGQTKYIQGRRTALPDVYIFAVLFLGLGSMWFHGSLKEWGGVNDGFSMYTFVGFILFYTIRRGISPSKWIFWIGYPATVLAFTAIGEIWSLASPKTSSSASLIMILTLLAPYAFCEIVWIPFIKDGVSSWVRSWRWWLGIGCIGIATLFWQLGKTGGPLCSPGSFWQPHGLIWHPFAGGAALCLYFYWRLDTQDSFQATGGYSDDIPMSNVG